MHSHNGEGSCLLDEERLVRDIEKLLEEKAERLRILQRPRLLTHRPVIAELCDA
jgi:hypothetical protein